MYRVLLMLSKRDNNQSLYRYYCLEGDDGVKTIYETNSIVELKETIKILLETYSKEKLLISKVIDWDALIELDEDDISSGTVITEMTSEDIDLLYGNLYEEVFG